MQISPLFKYTNLQNTLQTTNINTVKYLYFCTFSPAKGSKYKLQNIKIIINLKGAYCLRQQAANEGAGVLTEENYFLFTSGMKKKHSMSQSTAFFLFFFFPPLLPSV